MDTVQLKTAIIISCICAIAIVLRLIKPSWAIDDKTVFFLALGVIPWLPLFFKKIDLPGGFSAEAKDRKQGKSEPLPPVETSNQESTLALPGFDQKNDVNESLHLTKHAKKVLATLWRYQRQSFGNDNSKRWTFLIYPGSVEYFQFLTGVAELGWLGYVSINPENNQVALTNEGLSYSSKDEEIQHYPEYFKF